MGKPNPAPQPEAAPPPLPCLSPRTAEAAGPPPEPEREFVITSSDMRAWQLALDEARNAALWWKTEALIAESESIIAWYASQQATDAAIADREDMR